MYNISPRNIEKDMKDMRDHIIFYFIIVRAASLPMSSWTPIFRRDINERS